jgi:hypothetical protein
MKNSVKKELAQHILDRINDGVRDDWHFHCFNEDYYIIGYYEASQWLKAHDIDPFEAIGICQQWEEDMFGEKHNVYDNAETTVNMLAYIWGEELFAELDAETIEELTESLNAIIE